MIKYYDITEDELETKEFEAGALYYCTDSCNIYVDSANDNTRHKMSNTLIVLGTETDRTDLLAPIPNKLYCVLSTGIIYLYTTSGWIVIKGVTVNIQIGNIVVESGESSLTVENSSITSTCVGTFIPDSSVADLVTSSQVVCGDGSAVITVVSDYDISGTVYINE